MEKTVLLIGLGQFGYHMAVKMKELKSQVLGIDIDEERVNNCLPYLTSARIADSTDEVVVSLWLIILWTARNRHTTL